ncbi:MAG TPA: 16S rRNA (cytidine(1402)-2'-O)-methyltransferase [Pyrinomonadaceae bacterium]|nr:16S rRNA (cytidine(1402)-2'-O)-methyltransferase [Pyrinomonadaceae bacterium]
MPGTLYIVATPIGNLEDITQRALRILSEVKIIACEDTRHTRKLLDHYGIKTKTISYHEHNERDRATELLQLLEAGSDVAIVSDAGTPGISDPGFRIVSEAGARQITIVPVPGPTALIAALVASGMTTDQFFFDGFLPARGGARRSRLSELRSIPATLIFYEAPHRIDAALRDAHEILGNRKAAVARELTKIHEEIVRGTLGELVSHFTSAEKSRGEFVVLIDGTAVEVKADDLQPSSVSAIVARLEEQGMDHRAALKKAARELGLTRDEAYRRLMAERNNE